MPTHPLFDHIHPEKLAEARPWLQFVGAEAGTVLMQEGECDPCMVGILAGRVEVSRHGFLVDESGPGELLGELAVFSGRARGATVTMAEPGRLVLIDRVAYDALCELDNPVAYNLERAAIDDLSRRLESVNCRVARLPGGATSPYEQPPVPSMLGRILDRILGQSPEPRAEPAAPIDRVALLARSSLFADAPTAHLEAIAEKCRHVAYPRGSFLCTQGERGDQLFLLARGTVDVVVSEDRDPRSIHALGTMGPVSVFGVSALFGDRPRRASCVAFEPVETLELDRWAFEALVQANTPASSTFRRALIRGFSEQLEEASATLVAHAKRAHRASQLLELMKAGVSVDVTADLGVRRKAS